LRRRRWWRVDGCACAERGYTRARSGGGALSEPVALALAVSVSIAFPISGTRARAGFGHRLGPRRSAPG